MKNIPILLLLLVFASLVVVKENMIDRPVKPVKEGCLFCHEGVRDSDPSHPFSAFGCYTCHLGNPHSLDEERAHISIVMNPGDLRVVERTCGKAACHPEIAERVQKSIMATNKGILKTILQEWPDSGSRELLDSGGSLFPEGSEEAPVLDVRDLLSTEAPGNLAIDHYRKMCGGCHLWKKRGDRPGEIGRRGGGCSDCHVIDELGKKAKMKDPLYHPKMTTRIPSENCIKCHNRSARIGLSYFGRFESARYGTPYEGRELSSRKLSGRRFFLELQGDVHFREAGMECIDCHTSIGLMGDGKAHDKMEDQVDITCVACHSPEFKRVEDTDSLAVRLASLNKKVPEAAGRNIGWSKKDTPLYNLRKEGAKLVFYRKKDGKVIEMDTGFEEKPSHSMKGHERLSCQACHSRWIPQCYGCHLTYRKSRDQRDWISGEKRPGMWKEARSYMRFSSPALALRDNSSIYPVSPCQVFVNVFDGEERYLEKASFKILSFSAFDPHTTSSGSRACRDCHGDPKVMGIGEGLLYPLEEPWVFRPTYDSLSSGFDFTFPLDSYVDARGKRLQTSSRAEARPFNREELRRICRVNPCLGCHDSYDDVIYKDLEKALKRFRGDERLPCKD